MASGPEILASGTTARPLGVAFSPAHALRNRVLGALPAEDLARVQRHLELVWLEPHDELFELGSPIRYVYFPETAVISLVSTVGNGVTVEIGTAGSEGMVGLPVFLTADTSPARAFAQIAGFAGRMNADVFTRLSAAPGRLHKLLLRYAQAFLTQIAQTAACNAAHLVEARCARWILMTHDRVAIDEFALTQESLSFMLGVRRAGAMVAMRALKEAGLVRYTHGRVVVVDRRGLESASCECYRVVREHFERLLPPGNGSLC